MKKNNDKEIFNVDDIADLLKIKENNTLIEVEKTEVKSIDNVDNTAKEENNPVSESLPLAKSLVEIMNEASREHQEILNRHRENFGDNIEIEEPTNVLDNSSNTNPQNNKMNYGLIGIVVVVGIFLSLLIQFISNGNKFYTVTFMDVDGVYLVLDKVKSGSKVSEPAIPQKDNYEFLGWYLDDNKYDFNSPVKNDYYIKMKWLNVKTNEVEEVSKEKEEIIKKETEESKDDKKELYYTVTFKVDDKIYNTQKVKEGEIPERPVDPKVPEGSEFVGWRKGSDFYNFDVGITSNIVLLGVWKESGIDVNPTISLIDLPNSYYLIQDNVLRLKVKYTPSNATIKYESTDLNIATVSDDGVVTAVDIGDVDIYASIGDYREHLIRIHVIPKNNKAGYSNIYAIVYDEELEDNLVPTLDNRVYEVPNGEVNGEDIYEFFGSYNVVARLDKQGLSITEIKSTPFYIKDYCDSNIVLKDDGPLLVDGDTIIVLHKDITGKNNCS